MDRGKEAIICSGFGGQGMMVLGKVFASCGMKEGYKVTWMPSYGAEVRGGTAHSTIKIDTEEISSPMVSEVDTAIIMNGPSLDKFENKIRPGGLLILNTSMVERKTIRDDIDVVYAELTNEAIKLGNIKVANVIAAGIFAAKKEIITKKILIDVVSEMAKGREELVPVNLKAVELGMKIVNGEL
ncbi:MAG: 2-oxoacid:acceptor oxidoreductase family protein [Candidatus Omnitrophica bacterium]|nr:2-oxoacid:acceptor oxidoreductase family protein [Candidatus Omnitrophota bacterium]